MIKLSELVGRSVVVSVDGVEHKTAVSNVDAVGIDLASFGENNEWADGKHYSGIMKCLTAISDDGLLHATTERKGSIYSVTISDQQSSQGIICISALKLRRG